MPFVHLVIALALVEFFLFGVAVARARARYDIPAPATIGNEVFERYFRVQMNTLEQLVIFVPSVLLFVWGGYLFGNIPLVKRHFGVVTLLIVAVSLVPLASTLWRPAPAE